LSNNQHIIRRLAVNLDVQGSHQTNRVRNELLQYLHSELKRLLSNTFDEIAPSNEIIRIEKITLNLGAVKKGNLHQKIFNELSETLRKAIIGAKRGETQINGTHISITFSTPNQPVGDEKKAAAVIIGGFSGLFPALQPPPPFLLASLHFPS